jgi:hypothetical protein
VTHDSKSFSMRRNLPAAPTSRTENATEGCARTSPESFHDGGDSLQDGDYDGRLCRSRRIVGSIYRPAPPKALIDLGLQGRDSDLARLGFKPANPKVALASVQLP